jgi:hypothetical protein
MSDDDVGGVVEGRERDREREMLDMENANVLFTQLNPC